MDTFQQRCAQAFAQSKKLAGNTPNEAQLDNIGQRLREIFTEAELTQMDARTFMRQVERVWPIAKYVDRTP